MKVLHLIDHMGLGGAQRIVSLICENDKSNLHYVGFLRKKKDLIANRIKKNRCIYFPFSIFSIYNIFKLIKIKKIKVIHCHLVHSKFIGLFIKIICPRIKLIYHEHGGITKVHFLENFVQKRSKNYVDNYIAISNHVCEVLVSNFDIEIKKILIIYNPIDLLKYQKRKGQNKICNIGFAGRIVERKGWREFVETAKTLQKKYINLHFVIAGDGKEKKIMLKDIENCKYIKYLGYVSDMPNFYSKIDCLIVPSHWEPMGLVELEAQACGVPVIASNVAGLNEVVKDKENCLLFEPKNIDELANKVVELALDEEIKKKIIKNGIINSKKYSTSEYLKNIKKIYI